jgi:nucleotide-binding universal stress UspA family protein
MLADYRSILFCTDLSGNATQAFHHALQLAKTSGAEVHVLHVVEALSAEARVTIQAFFMNKSDRTEALENRAGEARAHLLELMDSFFADLDESDQAVRKQIVTIDVVEAYPAEQILKSRIKYDCDLIVMGAHEKGLSHNFLGSVAKSVLRRSNIPTLIVPLP